MVGTTYGAIDDKTTLAASIDPEVEKADASPSVDDPFDSEQTYYLKDNRRWTAQRLWNLVLPLVVAILLVGGAALFLFRDFGTLYPGQGNGGTDTGRSIPMASSSTSYNDKTVSNVNPSTKNDKSSGGKSTQNHSSTRDFSPSNDDDIGASCNVHPDCSMLIGNCCPTTDGKILECCNA